ncbi:hypothetical protein KEJ23_01185 [Candidatus Bathyarchaeota archaeon]|nr:hypothetical protein [Candidatus Bathyarchaeota archaeon]
MESTEYESEKGRPYVSGGKKAVALFSGGLDSALAVSLMLRQGFDVEGLFFTSPFCQCSGKGGCRASDLARSLGIRLKVVARTEEYIEAVRRPKYGYGRGLNPCIDCRILMLKEAKKYMEELGASIIITGEVLGERPMSQNRRALNLIERAAGLEGKVLRPLSAKLLPETEAERKGLVNRDMLLDIKGRSRKRQLILANELGVKGYSQPAGGCLLTDENFARKLEDLFKNLDKVTWRDIELLKIGRHFRYGPNKIVVGRDKDENKRLIELKINGEYYFEVPGYGSPVTLLQGPETEEAIRTAAALTAYYSDCKNANVQVMYGKAELERTITVPRPEKRWVDIFRIT